MFRHSQEWLCHLLSRRQSMGLGPSEFNSAIHVVQQSTLLSDFDLLQLCYIMNLRCECGI